jgi:hypothetical protein
MKRRASASARSRRPEWPWWAAPLFVGLLLRIALTIGSFGLTMDSGLYVNMAEAIARGRPEALGPAHHGYPALIALASLVVPGVEWPGRIVSLIAGLALIPLVYRLARRTLPPAASSLAATLVALHPLLAAYSVAIMTETSFLAVAYAGLWSIERGRLAIGGAVLGLSYWIRPEALVVAPAAAALARAPLARRLGLLAAFAVAIVPFLAYLRVERGVWSLTPKEVLVAPPLVEGHEVEPHLGPAGHVAGPDERVTSLARRIAVMFPAALPRYLPNLAGHLTQLVYAWPLPLLALSTVGLWRRGGPLAAPLFNLVVLPLLAVIANGRFPMLMIPALAVYAAQGAAWLADVLRRHARGRAPTVVTGTLALAGLTMAWLGSPGKHALHFDEQPMRVMRDAGLWLRANGRPGASVMDRKAFIPYFARMRHVQLPDEPYDRIVEHARSSGVEYLALEEYVVLSLRRQLIPLVTDPAFQEHERRLRLVYLRRDWPYQGVAIFAVVRDSQVTRP